MSSFTFSHSLAALAFACALVHTFSTQFFERLAHSHPRHAGLWHLLGEVEIVFGFWAVVLTLCLFLVDGMDPTLHYLETRNFTEPMFVFVAMVMAGTRPILSLTSSIALHLAQRLPLPASIAFFGTILCLVPLLGSFITEPAAMTLAALLLKDHYFSKQDASPFFKYATLGVLFVNISVGGTLTPFAAPPVLMVAQAWQWDLVFMLTTFGIKAIGIVGINTLLITCFFHSFLKKNPIHISHSAPSPPPLALQSIHLLFLAGSIAFIHHPVVFMGIFLLFLGIAQAYAHHQDRLILREGLLVAFFLAGLVVLGGKQEIWLSPLLMRLDVDSVFFGAAFLTAFTDNAAITYLGSLVPHLSAAFQYALVAGAISGGGLTIIANAPNPAGVAILRDHFHNQTIHPLGLLMAAVPPTLVAMGILWIT